MNNYLISITCVLLMFSFSGCAEPKLDSSVKSNVKDSSIYDQKIEDNRAFAIPSITNVSSSCAVTDNKQTMVIIAMNTSNQNIECTITCRYKNRNGHNTVFEITGHVPAKSNQHAWSTRFINGESFTVVGNSTQSCK